MIQTLLVCAAMIWSAPPGPAPSSDGVDSSEKCGMCHKTIYRTWKDSAHARALEDPIFLEAYRETETRRGKTLARVCLECHAPLVEINEDYDLEQRITWEGVNCEVCHALVSVDVTGARPKHVLEPGDVKRGPIKDAVAKMHDVAYSELHSSSLACAWCHEYVNAEGTAIMTTYSEWEASPMAEEGRTCQSCHMGESGTDVADPRTKRDKQARINLHEVPGGHSLEQLHEALGLTIDHERGADELQLALVVRNKGAGHAVPTGMPGRRVILELEVRGSDGQKFEERRVYEKSFVDADGNPILRDSDYFAPGVKLNEDTRLRGGEDRREEFRFPLPRQTTVYVTVKLHYEHAPTEDEDQRTWFTFIAERRTLTPPIEDRP